MCPQSLQDRQPQLHSTWNSPRALQERQIICDRGLMFSCSRVRYACGIDALLVELASRRALRYILHSHALEFARSDPHLLIAETTRWYPVVDEAMLKRCHAPFDASLCDATRMCCTCILLAANGAFDMRLTCACLRCAHFSRGWGSERNRKNAYASSSHACSKSFLHRRAQK